MLSEAAVGERRVMETVCVLLIFLVVNVTDLGPDFRKILRYS